MFRVRGPASRNCNKVRSKLTWPLPFGPPEATYVGILVDPIAALSRVDTDANEGLHVTRATNLAHAVIEKGEMKFVFTNPVLQVQAVIAVLPAFEFEFCGQDTHAAVLDPVAALKYVPAVQPTQLALPIPALNVPAEHGAHVPPFGPE